MEIALDVESATKEARDITSRTCDNAPLHLASGKTPPIHVVSDKTPPVANNINVITPTNFRQFLFKHYS